jgi:hypothetical protein
VILPCDIAHVPADRSAEGTPEGWVTVWQGGLGHIPVTPFHGTWPSGLTQPEVLSYWQNRPDGS